MTELEVNIGNHDQSKYSIDEFDPYLGYHYPEVEDEISDEQQYAYDHAWLHHQHVNGHHPQHWILVRDEGELVPIDMPDIYIIEMLCDWSSFQFVKDPKSTAHQWYKDNKKNMTLSDKTRTKVEKYLDIFKDI